LWKWRHTLTGSPLGFPLGKRSQFVKLVHTNRYEGIPRPVGFAPPTTLFTIKTICRMTTNGMVQLSANEFSGLVNKQKDRRSSLLDLTSGQHEVKTTGSGNARKVVLFKGTYTDRKGQQQIYPVVDVNGQAVALSALAGKAAIVADDGNLTPRPGIVEEGATYDDVLDALKANDFKFTLTHVVGRVNGFHGRYGVVTK